MLDQLERHAGNLAPYTELRLHNNYQTRVTMAGGVLVANEAGTTGGVSARSYQDGAFGFASLPSLSDDDVPAVLGRAADNASLVQRKTGTSKGDLPEAGAGHGSYDYRSPKAAVSAADRVEFVRAVDAYLRGAHPDLLNIDVTLSTLSIEKGLATSTGASTYSFVPRTIMVVQLHYQTDDGPVMIYDVFGGFGEAQEHLEGLEKVKPGLEQLYGELRDKASGVYAEPGYHDVVMGPDLAGILAHEAIGHTCEADLVLAGSVAGDHVGDLVASDKVTLVDFAGRGPDGGGGIAISVDDEGTPCRDVTIIENGVLKGFLHNKETARIMDAEPTGNARAFAFHDEPLVRMRNTAIVPGNDKLEDMISSVERGYYLKRATNGQADLTSEFMFGVGCGYEIVNGKLGRGLRDTTVAGVAFDMLKTITMVSDDMTWSHGGMCGKKQMIPVGMGGPAVRCRISLGGRQ